MGGFCADWTWSIPVIGEIIRQGFTPLHLNDKHLLMRINKALHNKSFEEMNAIKVEFNM